MRRRPFQPRTSSIDGISYLSISVLYSSQVDNDATWCPRESLRTIISSIISGSLHFLTDSTSITESNFKPNIGMIVSFGDICIIFLKVAIITRTTFSLIADFEMSMSSPVKWYLLSLSWFRGEFCISRCYIKEYFLQFSDISISLHH